MVVPNIIITGCTEKWPCHVQTCIPSFSPPDGPSMHHTVIFRPEKSFTG